MSGSWLTEQIPQRVRVFAGTLGDVDAYIRDMFASDILNDSDASGANVAEALTRLNSRMAPEWGTSAAAAVAGARYIPRSFGTISTNEEQSERTIPGNCQFRAMRITVANALALNTVTFTFRIDMVSTALTGVLPTGTPSIVVFADVFASANQRMAMQVNQSGSEANTVWNASVVVV